MEEVCNGCAMMNRIHIGDAVAVGEISIMFFKILTLTDAFSWLQSSNLNAQLQPCKFEH